MTLPPNLEISLERIALLLSRRRSPKKNPLSATLNVDLSTPSASHSQSETAEDNQNDSDSISE